MVACSYLRGVLDLSVDNTHLVFRPCAALETPARIYLFAAMLNMYNLIGEIKNDSSSLSHCVVKFAKAMQKDMLLISPPYALFFEQKKECAAGAASAWGQKCACVALRCHAAGWPLMACFVPQMLARPTTRI